MGVACLKKTHPSVNNFTNIEILGGLHEERCQGYGDCHGRERHGLAMTTKGAMTGKFAQLLGRRNRVWRAGRERRDFLFAEI